MKIICFALFHPVLTNNPQYLSTVETATTLYLQLEDTINAKLTELTIAEGFPDRSIGGKFHLVLVQTSSFESLLNLILSTSNAGPAQVKVPRKLRKAEWVKLLLNFEIV